MDNHSIYPNWRLTLDYVPLIVVISIVKEHVQTKKYSIIKDSDKKYIFIKELTESIRNINTSDIDNITHLDNIVNKFASSLESI